MTIADTGFTGYMAHEFVPTRDPLTSLREAIAGAGFSGSHYTSHCSCRGPS
ncbi:MAG TPA: hypothetical protein VKP66_05535 [Steroidobacteraceae bacterium]|nr:hypothetical protein [Steroidobacteraceae bacterium]